MSTLTHPVESTRATPALYMALELSATTWHLVFGVGLATAVRHRTIAAGDVAGLRAEIGRARQRFGLAADAPVRSCYEAGREGFWVHRHVTREGLTNVVVDSSSIEVSRRARRAKTDRLDGGKLWRLLVRYWSGERDVWHVVRVPSEALEDSRHQERGIATLVAERTAWRNRIHGLLMLHGRRTRITPRFGTQLAALRDWQGDALPPGVVRRITDAWQVLTTIEAHLRAARRAQRAELAAATSAPAQIAARLQRLRGVGARSAAVLAKELFSRDLRNRREVGALTGLVGTPYASGGTVREQGISRAGLARVRAIAVELAWAWRRYQPHSAVTQWFEQRFGAGGRRSRKVGIVALARRLVIALWQYTRTGVVPVGAIGR
jgi:transposase